MRSGPAPDPFMVGLGLLSLLSAQTPTLCVIDDAQWLDPFSAEALVVATRRLSSESIAILVAARSPNGDDDPLRSLPEYWLEGLSPADSWRLLSSTLHGPLDVRVRDQIVAEARGNPLAIVELIRNGGPAAMAGGYGLPRAVSPLDRVANVYRRQIAELSADARAALLVAAADPTGDPALVWQATATMGLNKSAMADAVDSGLIEVVDRVRFRHPLARSVVYQSAELTERRSAHAALAAATDPDNDYDRAVWHRARAADPPDENVSMELERVAEHARLRGGVAAYAAFLECAVALSANRSRRTELVLAAAIAKHEAGDLEGAAAFVATAELLSTNGRQRAKAAVLSAQISFDRVPGMSEATQLLDAAAELDRYDPAAATETYLCALIASIIAGRLAAVPATTIAEAVMTRPTAPGDGTRRIDRVLRALTVASVHGPAQAVAPARDAIAALTEDDSAQRHDLIWVWLLCAISWNDDAWTALADRYLRSLRAAGRLTEMPQALDYRALAHIHAGELSLAEQLDAEAKQIRGFIGAEDSYYVALHVAAWRGDRKAFASLTTRAAALARQRGEGRILSVASYAQVLMNNGTGRYQDALSALRDDHWSHDIGYHLFVPPELIEAATHTGHSDIAQQALDRLAEHANAAGTPWALGVERRCRALVTTGQNAEKFFIESVEHLRDHRTPPQLARTRLLFGEWLRRQQRRSEAREQLRAAYSTFSEMGARHFADRAARELRAAGETPRRPLDDNKGLTAQELAIARLVSRGATSKEVAGELVLSPRTVDAHLRNIFAKLGITSRRQIRHALGSELQGDPAGPAS